MRNHFFEVSNFDLNRVASPPRNLLEQTRLSCLPTLPRRTSACLGCGGTLEADNEYQLATKVCRKCANQFAKLAAIYDEYADAKAKAARVGGMR